VDGSLNQLKKIKNNNKKTIKKYIKKNKRVESDVLFANFACPIMSPNKDSRALSVKRQTNLHGQRY